TGGIERVCLTVARTRFGRSAFVGNSAVVPGGVELGDGSLGGVLSLAPAHNSESAKPGATWLGSPTLLPPRREASTGFKEERTYNPPRTLVLTRAELDTLRVTLP